MLAYRAQFLVPNAVHFYNPVSPVYTSCSHRYYNQAYTSLI